MTCPICRKEAVTRYRPFCSARCANVDLGRWFGEGYSIPVQEDHDDVGAVASEHSDEE